MHFPGRPASQRWGACKGNTLHNLWRPQASACHEQKAARSPPVSRSQVTHGFHGMQAGIPARPLGGKGRQAPAAWGGHRVAMHRAICPPQGGSQQSKSLTHASRAGQSSSTEGSGTVKVGTTKAWYSQPRHVKNQPTSCPASTHCS